MAAFRLLLRFLGVLVISGKPSAIVGGLGTSLCLVRLRFLLQRPSRLAFSALSILRGPRKPRSATIDDFKVFDIE